MSNNSLINVKNALIDLGKLSEPANTLIKKISLGIGGVFRPYQIKRIAEAEAEAAVIKAQADAQAAKMTAESDIEVTNLRQRAVYRLIEEETIHQKSIEDVIVKALPDLNKDADPEAMVDDWIANFFDKCRIISNSEMQSLWARLLAGEANSPGTYSKRTVNFVSELDKKEADLFTKLCGFGWVIEEELMPFVFNYDSEIYIKHELCFENLSHLDSIGLIHFDYSFNFAWEFLDTNVETYVVHYYETPLNLEFSSNYKKIQAGGVSLTKIGQELAPISGSKSVEGFYEYVKDQWWQYLSESEKK